MNYYEHHIGDAMKDMAHLSMLEEGAYRRLMDAYYSRERALPADIRECCKLARATTKAEREAVSYVVKEFFTLTDDGHHQKRCDEEIARFHDKQAKAKRSAEARWENASGRCERNANASETGMRTHSERNANGMHRAPVPSNQTPVTNQDQDQERFQTGEVPPASPAREEPDNRTTAGTVCARLRAEAGMIHTNPSDPRLLAALAVGTPPDLIVDLAKEHPGKPLAYAVKAARGRHQDALSAASTGGPAHASQQRTPGTNHGVQRLTRRQRVRLANGLPIDGDEPPAATGRVIDGQFNQA